MKNLNVPKNLCHFALGIILSSVSPSLFAIGSANLPEINTSSLPGSSFVLQTGSTSTGAGRNFTLTTTTTQCPAYFQPMLMTSIADTYAPGKSSCSIAAIHAIPGQAEVNGRGGYNIVMNEVEVNSKGDCPIKGLQINWSVYCMPTNAA